MEFLPDGVIGIGAGSFEHSWVATETGIRINGKEDNGVHADLALCIDGRFRGINSNNTSLMLVPRN
jgi:hypothetical protein